MNPDTAPAAAPNVTLGGIGPRALALVEALAATFPTSHSAARAGGCQLLIVSSAAWNPGDLPALLPATPVRGPLWLAAVGADATEVQRLDAALESQQLSVDALLVVADNDAAGVALEAWIRLRHDAPARAFADLRDADDRACRVAAITAVAPSTMPSLAARLTPGDGGNLLSNRIQTVAATLAQAAEVRTAAKLAELADAHGSQLVDALTALSNPGPDPEASDTDTAAAEIVASIDDDPHLLRNGLVAAAELADVGSDRTDLDAATMAVVAADAAFVSEANRVGFTAKFGRKKRLALLAAARSTALADVAPRATAVARSHAQRTFANCLEAELRPRLVPAQHAQERAAERETAHARQQWLESAVRLANQTTPPLAVDPAALSTSWGSAAPGIRRYLVLPDDPQTETTEPSAQDLVVPPGEAAGVVLHIAPDLTRPLVAALVLGVPAAALIDTGTAVGSPTPSAVVRNAESAGSLGSLPSDPPESP